MIKHTVEISREPLHLSVRLDQLRLRRDDPTGSLVSSIPCEDIGLVVVDHPQATYSHHALATLCRYGAAVLVCGGDHLPIGMLLPLTTHSEVVHRLDDQINARKPLRKRLWQQLVVAKIRASAEWLTHAPEAQARLRSLARQVRSGDTTNKEAQAARVVWSTWRVRWPDFRRDPDGKDGTNAMLNYGYAVFRAAVGRALVSAGFHPALGLHHSNRSNPFCLADDLLEPLRPIVDECVFGLRCEGKDELTPETKAALLALLTRPVYLGKRRGPFMVALHLFTASLARCLAGERKKLRIPRAKPATAP